MNIENYILYPIEMVTAWDPPEEELADTGNGLAKLMVGKWQFHSGHRRSAVPQSTVPSQGPALTVYRQTL